MATGTMEKNVIMEKECENGNGKHGTFADLFFSKRSFKWITEIDRPSPVLNLLVYSAHTVSILTRVLLLELRSTGKCSPIRNTIIIRNPEAIPIRELWNSLKPAKQWQNVRELEWLGLEVNNELVSSCLNNENSLFPLPVNTLYRCSFNVCSIRTSEWEQSSKFGKSSLHYVHSLAMKRRFPVSNSERTAHQLNPHNVDVDDLEVDELLVHEANPWSTEL